MRSDSGQSEHMLCDDAENHTLLHFVDTGTTTSHCIYFSTKSVSYILLSSTNFHTISMKNEIALKLPEQPLNAAIIISLAEKGRVDYR